MSEAISENNSTDIQVPMAMLAELTHRCPLQCPYCSNPVDLVRKNKELSTGEWTSVFEQAAEMGVLHVHLSGGEPAARRDLEELTEAAHNAGLYTNLITSGVGLTEKRIHALKSKGLDHIQLSIQGPNSEIADLVGGYKGGFEKKIEVAAWIKTADIPLTVNAVMHRKNIEQLPDMIELAIKLGARRLEVANTQYHGWAYQNRGALMPSQKQSEKADKIVDDARERLKGTLVIDYVPTDYHATYPKACMGGWGRVGLNIVPSGDVMPCHVAASIPHLKFDNIKDKSLSDIWYKSEAFNMYRGTDWMSETCRNCDRKELDFGGCRCQAFAITGDASATDPVCHKSPDRQKLEAFLAEDLSSEDQEFSYRKFS